MCKHIAVSIRMVLPLCLLAIAGPAAAHHSGAGYDLSKTLEADATLKEFRWGAPHSAVVFTVKIDGKMQDVNLGGASPGAFARQGFKPRDFRMGDKMHITWHPSKSGALGGTLATITMPDGRKFGDAEFGPGGSRAGGAPGGRPGGPGDSQVETATFPPGTGPQGAGGGQR